MTLDAIWIGIAFIFGYGIKRIGLPPMVGFLLAGFVIFLTGSPHGELIDQLADLGVLLLLYTIGLKVNIRSLGKKAVLGGGLLSTVISITFGGIFLFAMANLNVPFFKELSFSELSIIAFALSFSSTVFVIKILEERGNMNSAEGKVAIGILIIQDILAVVFITFSKGEIPSPYAFLLIFTPILRPLMLRILKYCGHGELLTLFGLFMAMAGAQLFDVLGLKADLGALVFGMILSSNERSEEMAKNLLHFKDVFLIAFFLNIGFNGIPGPSALLAGIVLSILLLAKPIIYHFSLTCFRFPVQSSYFASISLTNFSEFALIVVVLASKLGLIQSEWLVIISLAITISFIVSSFLNGRAHLLYKKYKDLIYGFLLAEPEKTADSIDFGKADILIIGMGTLGSNLYDKIKESSDEKLLGLDSDQRRVIANRNRGRNVALHDATDIEFWEKVDKDSLNKVVLALPRFQNNIFAIKRLKALERPIDIFATARYSDEIEMLKNAGANYVYSLYEEVGKGLASEIIKVKEQLN